jgi:hypothetical protein
MALDVAEQHRVAELVRIPYQFTAADYDLIRRRQAEIHGEKLRLDAVENLIRVHLQLDGKLK